MRFRSDNSPDNEFVEDGEWATCEYRMSPSEVIKYFGDQLSKDDIDMIYQSWSGYQNGNNDADFFSLDERYNDYDDNSTISALHAVWKSLRKIGFFRFLKMKMERCKKLLLMKITNLIRMLEI